MAEVVLIMGASGSGKSTSLRNLSASETFVINSLGKSLPFKGSAKTYTMWSKDKNPNGNMLKSSDSNVTLRWLDYIDKNMSNIKNVVIEDNTHQSSMEYIRRIKDTGWEKFNDIASNMVSVVERAKQMRDDITVFIIHHTKEVGDGILENKFTKAMTLGKLVDEKMSSYEAFFTIVLLARKKKTDDKVEYVFVTNDADSTTKSPMGMFDTDEIPNDLQLVKDSIKSYYHDEEEVKAK